MKKRKYHPNWHGGRRPVPRHLSGALLQIIPRAIFRFFIAIAIEFALAQVIQATAAPPWLLVPATAVTITVMIFA